MFLWKHSSMSLSLQKFPYHVPLKFLFMCSIIILHFICLSPVFSAVVTIEFLNISLAVDEGNDATFCVALNGSLERMVTFSLQSSNQSGTADMAENGRFVTTQTGNN